MSVCLSCSFILLLLFCFLMESSHFLAVSSPCGTLQNCFSLIFDLGPLAPKIYSPKLAQNRLSRLVWQIDRRRLGLLRGFRGWPIQWNHAKCCGADPCAMATKFGLGAEMQSPTGLSVFQRIMGFGLPSPVTRST